MKRPLTYAAAINEALYQAMDQDSNVIVFGLGADDPRRIFGTTKGLCETFGRERVFDMPASENAMTGVAIGASLNGIRPVMICQRVDFFLLAMDQLINNAAKWHFMFNGLQSVPLTIRLIIGRGWGQGPTHSQDLHSLFALTPGLKVVMPSTAYDAKGLLLESIADNNPVVYLEHRWLHNTEGDVPEEKYGIKIGEAHTVREGSDVTIVAMSLMTVEAIHAVDLLAKKGIYCDLIDLRTIRPLDLKTIENSVRKTGRLLVVDNGHSFGSIAGEIISTLVTEQWSVFKSPPERLAMPNFPESTSFALTKNYHIRAEHIASKVAEMLGICLSDEIIQSLINERTHPHDVPGAWFAGPF